MSLKEGVGVQGCEGDLNTVGLEMEKGAVSQGMQVDSKH